MNWKEYLLDCLVAFIMLIISFFAVILVISFTGCSFDIASGGELIKRPMTEGVWDYYGYDDHGNYGYQGSIYKDFRKPLEPVEVPKIGNLNPPPPENKVDTWEHWYIYEPIIE